MGSMLMVFCPLAARTGAGRLHVSCSVMTETVRLYQAQGLAFRRGTKVPLKTAEISAKVSCASLG